MTVVASCPNRQQGEPCSLPWPSELQIHSTQLLTITCRERGSLFIAGRKSIASKERISLDRQKDICFLPSLPGLFLRYWAQWYFLVSRCLYISSHLHLYPDLSPFLQFHFSCGLKKNYLVILSIITPSCMPFTCFPHYRLPWGSLTLGNGVLHCFSDMWENKSTVS